MRTKTIIIPDHEAAICAGEDWANAHQDNWESDFDSFLAGYNWLLDQLIAKGYIFE